ncbi:4-hydroxy-tetrahydrodipicolinate synthase [Halioxenophilus aromaticivorans]|uniref:4-hydroxy-tetrahydrodipicolinate synthase n=1 Tax=Halioxenophilus aromaticivorans TaxID=1306992 RepID=A0AAV3TYZ7_9ALTE
MIEGSMVALVTPMTAAGDLDWEALRTVVEWHIEQGTHSIVAVGTTGESPTLSPAEHLEVIAKVVDQVNGRIPVIAGTGANATAEALELTQAAKERGADACLSVTPYYNKPTQEGLFQHFKYVADRVAIPQILYNVPGRTGVDLSNETVLRLAQVDNIVGLKDATGDVARGKALLAEVDKSFAVYSGDDLTAVELILAGGKGNISVTANVVPSAVSAMCVAALQGDNERALQINDKLMPLNRALFVESNPIPVKWAMARIGKTAGGIRLPLTPLAEQFHEPMEAALTLAGALD